ncbi:MAG: Uncharacterised protein [SAR116 cluster bacterium MED-G04]|nr:MAG: Uncharacterised protein [SAR116 cluster bacterium MED-G04]
MQLIFADPTRTIPLNPIPFWMLNIAMRPSLALRLIMFSMQQQKMIKPTQTSKLKTLPGMNLIR